MKTLPKNANRNEALNAIDTIIDTIGDNAFIEECLAAFATKYLIDIANHFIRYYDLQDEE